MLYVTISRLAIPFFVKTCNFIHFTKCHTLFGIKELIRQEKVHEKSQQFILNRPSKSQVLPLTSETHALGIDTIKRLYLSEHAFVRSRDMDIYSDRALDEYLLSLLKQGNSLYTKSEDGGISAICVNFASSSVDTKNLCNFASYRQDPNTKELLYFIAKLQETPNLWDQYKQNKIFEIKMLAVAPEYRRRGLATLLAEKSKEQAWDLGYNVVRMDCINDNDFKIAEQCMLQCVAMFPVHKLGDHKAPYIKEDSKYNRIVRVYVDDRRQSDDEKRRREDPLILEVV